MRSFLVDAGRVGASAGAGGREGRRRWRDAALQPRLLVLDDDHGELVLLDPLEPAVCARLPLASVAQIGCCEQTLETASPRRPQRSRRALLLAVTPSDASVVAAGPRDDDGGLRIVLVPRFARDFDAINLRLFQSPWTEQLGSPSPEAAKVLASLDVEEDWTLLALDAMHSFDLESFGERTSQGPPQPRFSAPPEHLRLGISQTHVCLAQANPTPASRARTSAAASSGRGDDDGDGDGNDGLVLLYQEPLCSLARASLLADAVVLLQFASGRTLRFSCTPATDVPALVAVLLGRARYLQMEQAGLIAHSVMGWFEGSADTVSRLAQLAGIKPRPVPPAVRSAAASSRAPSEISAVSPLAASLSVPREGAATEAASATAAEDEDDEPLHTDSDPVQEDAPSAKAVDVLARAQMLLAKFSDNSWADSASVRSQDIGDSELDAQARSDDSASNFDDKDSSKGLEDAALQRPSSAQTEVQGSEEETEEIEEDGQEHNVGKSDTSPVENTIGSNEKLKESGADQPEQSGDTAASPDLQQPTMARVSSSDSPPKTVPEDENWAHARSPVLAFDEKTGEGVVLQSPLSSPPPPPPSDSPPSSAREAPPTKSWAEVPGQHSNNELSRNPGEAASRSNLGQGSGREEEDDNPGGEEEDTAGEDEDGAEDADSQAGSPLAKTLEIMNMQAAREGLSVPVVGDGPTQRRRRSTTTGRQRSPPPPSSFSARRSPKSKRRSTTASCKQQ